MPFLIIIILAIALFLIDAFLLSLGVPRAITDPSDWGAWLMIIAAVVGIRTSFNVTK